MENNSEEINPNVDMVNAKNIINGDSFMRDDGIPTCKVDSRLDIEDTGRLNSDDDEMVIPSSNSPVIPGADYMPVKQCEECLVIELKVNEELITTTAETANLATDVDCDMSQQNMEEATAECNTKVSSVVETQIEIDIIPEKDVDENLEVANMEKKEFIKVIELTPSGMKIEKFCNNLQEFDSPVSAADIEVNEEEEDIEITDTIRADGVDHSDLAQAYCRKDAVHFSSPLSVVYEYAVSQNTCSQSTQDITDLVDESHSDDDNLHISKTNLSNADMTTVSNAVIANSNSPTTTIQGSYDLDCCALVKPPTNVTNIMTPAGDCCNSEISANVYVVNRVDLSIESALPVAPDILHKDDTLSDVICINDIPNSKLVICEEYTTLSQNDVEIEDEHRDSTVKILSANLPVHSEECLTATEGNNNGFTEEISAVNDGLSAKHSDSLFPQKENRSVKRIERILGEFLVKKQFFKIPLTSLEDVKILVSPNLGMDIENKIESTIVDNTVDHINQITEKNIESSTQGEGSYDKMTHTKSGVAMLDNTIDKSFNNSEEDLFTSDPEMDMNVTDKEVEIKPVPEASVKADKSTNINANNNSESIHHIVVCNSQNDIFDSDSQKIGDIEISNAEIMSVQCDECETSVTFITENTSEDSVACKTETGKQALADGTGVLYGGHGGPIKRLTTVDDTDSDAKKLKIDEDEIPGTCIGTLKRVQLFENINQIPVKKTKLFVSEKPDKDHPKSLKSIAAQIVSTSEDNIIWENNVLHTNLELESNSEKAESISEIDQISTHAMKISCSCVCDSGNIEDTVNMGGIGGSEQMMVGGKLPNIEVMDSNIEVLKSETCICNAEEINTTSNNSEVEKCECNCCTECFDLHNENTLTVNNVSNGNATEFIRKDETLEMLKLSKTTHISTADDEEKVVEIEASPRFITATEYHSQSESSQVSSTGFNVDTKMEYQLSSQESCKSIPVVLVAECQVVKGTTNSSSEYARLEGMGFDGVLLDTIVEAAVDQVVPGQPTSGEDNPVDAECEEGVTESLYADYKAKDKMYTCDIDLCGDDGGRICQTVDEGSKAKTTPVTGLPSHEKCFKWKYTPSCDLDSDPLPTEDDNQVIQIEPLKTCSKPIRLGLSRRQTVNRLHKFNTH